MRGAFTRISITRRRTRCISVSSLLRRGRQREWPRITKSITPSIFGDAEVAGTRRSRLLELLRSSDFPTEGKNQELLPLNAADRASPRPLTKIQDEENITIHRSARSTYPEEKSVLTSGATPQL